MKTYLIFFLGCFVGVLGGIFLVSILTMAGRGNDDENLS
jgi:hypothetical protein